MEKLSFRYLLIVSVLALAGCETPVNQLSFPEQTFQHLPPISLDVREIDIVHRFEPPLKAPHIEHEMPVPPHIAVERWIVDRLRATGTSGRAVVTIRDASVVEARLRRLGGIKGTFTTEQSERYDAKVEIIIEATDDKGLRSANAVATSLRNRSVPEHATLRERRTLWYELTEKLMSDFDRTFESQIRKHLAAFLK
tara:strand:+ start:1816 stop:2403 length:588 start_codon:yes stop_codon:yes gene_type:complete